MKMSLLSKWIFGGLAFVVGVLVTATIAIPAIYKEPGGAGEFGDMFGAPNALFSGFAFLGVIVAILLQKQELSLQREELQHTRGELAGQRRQLKQQTFDNIFFHLLSLHNEIVKDMAVGDKMRDPKYKTGRDCFEQFCEALRSRPTWDKYKQLSMDDPTALNKIYVDFYKDVQADVGHYFRHLYNIVKFVDQSDTGDRQFYANLIRAQLSSDELVLLFYNCISEFGNEKFMPLVNQYSLLKQLPLDKLLDKGHRVFYTGKLGA